MDHKTSIRTQAAEKYLLGELSPADRDGFEQHYFECAECAEEIRLTFAFLENGRAVLEDGPPAIALQRASERRDWFAWLRPMMWAPVAACLALMTFTGYQNVVVIPGLRARAAEPAAAQALPSLVLLPPSRAAIPSIRIPHAAQFFQLSLDTISANPAGRFECVLRSASGQILASIPAATPDGSGTLNLLIPAKQFAPGPYEAVLSAAGPEGVKEAGRYPFSVRRE